MLTQELEEVYLECFLLYGRRYKMQSFVFHFGEEVLVTGPDDWTSKNVTAVAGS